MNNQAQPLLSKIMAKNFSELNEKIKALRGISLIQRTWADVACMMSEKDRSGYLMMLDTAKFFMMRNDFIRVNREYRVIHNFLQTVQARGEDKA